ncbi:MAG: TolC family protein [Phycisphaeraceae bacterium]
MIHLVHIAGSGRRLWRAAAWSLPLVILANCHGPLDSDDRNGLRNRLVAEYRERLTEPPDEHATVEQLYAHFPADRDRRLDHRGSGDDGAEVDGEGNLEPGEGMSDQSDREVDISITQALDMALAHNLDYQVARFAPVIASERLREAEAAFDPALFLETQWSDAHRPRPSGTIPGLTGDQRSEQFELSTGLRVPLDIGTELTLQGRLRRQMEDPSVFADRSYYESELSLGIRQPLLRGFGHAMNRAEIRLIRNLEQAETEQLREELIALAGEVEEAYWSLFLAHRRYRIQSRLLERTIAERERLRQREDVDVTPIERAEVDGFVETRRGARIRARRDMRRASDELKRLLNAPDLPLMDKVVLRPRDEPVAGGEALGLDKLVAQAIRNRPALAVALLEIDDADIRETVARRSRLPVADLIAEAGSSGLDLDAPGHAARRATEFDYLNYLVGLEVEVPIGNRAARARHQRSRRERQQATAAYRARVHDVVMEVKDAQREVESADRLIDVAREGRRAVARVLHTLEQEEELGVALTPAFVLDKKLDVQERLAEAQIHEAEAEAAYMVAVARLHQATGTLLDENEIEFIEAEQ